MPPNQLNPVDAIVALLLLVFSPEAAKIVGPYAVIILSATVGAAWSLGRRQPSQKHEALYFFLKIIGTACLVTVSLASLLKYHFELTTDINWLFAPIGLVIGGVGEDWQSVGKWAANHIRNIVDRRVGEQGATGDRDHDR